jgi:hypothetical protein
MPVIRDKSEGEREGKPALMNSDEWERLKKIDPAVGPTYCKACGNHSIIKNGVRSCCGVKDVYDPAGGK